MKELSLAQARAIAIGATKLDAVPANATKADVLATIRNLGVLQIDTIHVVARAHYFVLWSRLGQYDPEWFDELYYPDKTMFEYWAHAASFVPIEYWSLFRAKVENYSEWGWGNLEGWSKENQAILEHVKQRITHEGPLRSIDFKADNHQTGGWWNWKPAKKALDVLWNTGELMIQQRIKFQRVYDLTERFLPEWDPAETPDYATANQRLSEIALRAMGIATARQLADYYRQKRQGMSKLLESWVESGQVHKVSVAGWNEPAYVHGDYSAWVEDGAPEPRHTTLLTPFDNLIWDRERTAALWNFDYKIECYTPAAKRRYGYFSLPILWHDQLVGRLDAKAERKAGIFRIFAIHMEPDVALESQMIADIRQAIQDCAAWHTTPEVQIQTTYPPELKQLLS